MIVVFALNGTKEKVAVECVSENIIPTIQKKLNELHGGIWVEVEQIGQGSVLFFENEQPYPDVKKTNEKYVAVHKLF